MSARGWDPNARNHRQWSALHFAVEKGSMFLPVVKALIGLGVTLTLTLTLSLSLTMTLTLSLTLTLTSTLIPTLTLTLTLTLSRTPTPPLTTAHVQSSEHASEKTTN